MVLAGKVWNSLEPSERLEILQDGSHKSQGVMELEAELDWEDLLPSTQKGLLEVDFSAVLGRDVCL